nr:cold shock domain-containing protein [Alkalicoccus urumqiensis]
MRLYQESGEEVFVYFSAVQAERFKTLAGGRNVEGCRQHRGITEKQPESFDMLPAAFLMPSVRSPCYTAVERNDTESGELYAAGYRRTDHPG